MGGCQKHGRPILRVPKKGTITLTTTYIRFGDHAGDIYQHIWICWGLPGGTQRTWTLNPYLGVGFRDSNGPGLGFRVHIKCSMKDEMKTRPA